MTTQPVLIKKQTKPQQMVLVATNEETWVPCQRMAGHVMQVGISMA